MNIRINRFAFQAQETDTTSQGIISFREFQLKQRIDLLKYVVEVLVLANFDREKAAQQLQIERYLLSDYWVAGQKELGEKYYISRLETRVAIATSQTGLRPYRSIELDVIRSAVSICAGVQVTTAKILGISIARIEENLRSNKRSVSTGMNHSLKIDDGDVTVDLINSQQDLRSLREIMGQAVTTAYTLCQGSKTDTAKALRLSRASVSACIARCNS